LKECYNGFRGRGYAMNWFELFYIIGTLGATAIFIWLGIKSIKRRRAIKEGKIKKDFPRDF
jgi:hypothetical protein